MTAGYAVDWTGRFSGTTPAVVRPGSTTEVSRVMEICCEHGLAVVPQGGNTGLVGGGVPLGGEVVLSLRRLRRLDAVEQAAGQVTAGAGVTIAELQDHAEASGWRYAVDLGARESATVGGTIATNAGGLRMIRYGGTRQQLTGIEAVLADGRVLSHLGGLVKDNTGYDLASLLCGSEGTLAVVSAARLRLHPPSPEVVTALLAFSDTSPAFAAAAGLRRTLPELEAVEFFLHGGLALVSELTGAKSPFSKAFDCYLLVEAAGVTDPGPALESAIARTTGVADVAVALSDTQRRRLWHLREAHTEVINTLGPPHKLDVTLPHEALAAFVGDVSELVQEVAPGAEAWFFGHAGDGNLHVNVTGVEPYDDTVDTAVLSLVAHLGGSISAEHGVGRAKLPYLHLNRSPGELSVFRAIKAAFDPRGILNPGVLLPAPDAAAEG
ncbi:MAG: putative FAD-linked oxidoreductase [Acidimicrobiales bacterium]|nr:MAG: FAD-binding oxidoreductase [Actinomycetota bacterium]MBV6508280.1 putative FAD-linked oxidoreductase [Acidimicrobiales bacterium]RIK07359.1 MAG: FAD-binding oxidoreductase [Acidobacteriota bacterium]